MTAVDFFVETQRIGIATGVIYTPGEAMADPHFVARGFPVEIEHPELDRSFTYPGAPYRFTATPWSGGGRPRRARAGRAPGHLAARGSAGRCGKNGAWTGGFTFRTWATTRTATGSSRSRSELNALGYHSGWVSDHIAWPSDIESRYPYTPDGAFPAPQNMPWLDPIGTLFFVAGCTERLKLGTTVLILGYRPPVQTAKAIASLDVVSEGRVILGVGVGWMREEFEVLGMPYDHRGRAR